MEINSTSSGVAECKKIFAEAKNELGLTGRRTILFCDEIHRFSKSQQDVFLGPVEAGHVTLIGATTGESPLLDLTVALLFTSDIYPDIYVCLQKIRLSKSCQLSYRAVVHLLFQS